MKKILTFILSILLISSFASAQFLAVNPATGLLDWVLYMGGTSGDILYHNGTDWVVLAKDDNGKILKLVAGLPSWQDESGGASVFTDLTDTPANYAGAGGYLVRVNATPDGLEFVDGTTLFFDEHSDVDHNQTTNYDANRHFLQSEITTVGAIGAGAWQGTAIVNTYGGTGQNSSGWTGYPYVSAGAWAADTQLSRITDGIEVKSSGANPAIIRLNDGDTNYANIAVQALSANLTFTLPASYASEAGQYYKDNDGAGTWGYGNLVDITNGLKIYGAGNDHIDLTHDATDAFMKWSDGLLQLQTDEGTNTDTEVKIIGKGTGDGVIDIYGGGSTYYHIVKGSDAEGLAGADLRIGLDESLRILWIGDIGDINADHGMAAQSYPSIAISSADASKETFFWYGGITSATNMNWIGRRHVFTVTGADISAEAQAYSFIRDAGYGLNVSTGIQAWMDIESRIEHSGDAKAIGIRYRSNESSLGSGGHLMMDLGVTSTLFAIKNDGSIWTVKAVANTNTPSGATAYAYPIYDASGNLLGYIPIYAAEW